MVYFRLVVAKLSNSYRHWNSLSNSSLNQICVIFCTCLAVVLVPSTVGVRRCRTNESARTLGENLNNTFQDGGTKHWQENYSPSLSSQWGTKLSSLNITNTVSVVFYSRWSFYVVSRLFPVHFPNLNFWLEDQWVTDNELQLKRKMKASKTLRDSYSFVGPAKQTVSSFYFNNK